MQYKLRDDHPDARQFRLAWHVALRPDFVTSGRLPARKLSKQRQATSSPLQALQTYLAKLREQEQELGFRTEG